ncbi:MAG: hypothetical protein ACJ71J_04365 [Nitrososphaeraceae archaeon]|jgi:hypothetical protein
MKEFALRGYHLVLEVITLMVRNTVEGIHYKGLFCPCCGMQLRLRKYLEREKSVR